MKVSVTDMAKVAHEVNRAYCKAIGDDSQVPFEEAPQWQKDSVVAGVQAVLQGGVCSPGESHANWLAVKRADGWTYGKVKDAEKKTHPCLVEYDELPPEQQVRDQLFLAVVAALR